MSLDRVTFIWNTWHWGYSWPVQSSIYHSHGNWYFLKISRLQTLEQCFLYTIIIKSEQCYETFVCLSTYIRSLRTDLYMSDKHICVLEFVWWLCVIVYACVKPLGMPTALGFLCQLRIHAPIVCTHVHTCTHTEILHT